MAAARRWQDERVVFEDPETVYIDDGVSIGPGTVIGPNTHLKGRTRIGRDCRIDGSAFLTNAEIGDRVHLKFSVVISDSKVGDDGEVGPFAHLRPGTALAERVHIGNFVETKKAVVGAGSKANHLSYLGDVTVGAGRKRRRRNDHLQLRRLREIPDDDRRSRAGRKRHHPGRAGDPRRRRLCRNRHHRTTRRAGGVFRVQ